MTLYKENDSHFLQGWGGPYRPYFDWWMRLYDCTMLPYCHTSWINNTLVSAYHTATEKLYTVGLLRCLSSKHKGMLPMFGNKCIIFWKMNKPPVSFGCHSYLPVSPIWTLNDSQCGEKLKRIFRMHVWLFKYFVIGIIFHNWVVEVADQKKWG